jgi:hypothetical protein
MAQAGAKVQDPTAAAPPGGGGAAAAAAPPGGGGAATAAAPPGAPTPNEFVTVFGLAKRDIKQKGQEIVIYQENKTAWYSDVEAFYTMCEPTHWIKCTPAMLALASGKKTNNLEEWFKLTQNSVPKDAEKNITQRCKEMSDRVAHYTRLAKVAKKAMKTLKTLKAKAAVTKKAKAMKAMK